MLLTVYTSLFCYLNFDGLLFLGACGFWDMLVCAFHLLCAFRVWTYGFAFLYVNEFLFAACGVSPLRGRPALAKAQGLDPNAF